MMNQKEIEALISIRRNLAILEEGSVKCSACPSCWGMWPCPTGLDGALIHWQEGDARKRPPGEGGWEGEEKGVERGRQGC